MLRRPARQRCDGADGARDAYKFYYSVRISYEFLISDCRGDSDLGLCTSWHLAKKMPLRSGRICFQQANRRNSEPIRPLRSGIFFARCQDVHRRQACSALQIDIRNLYDIHTQTKIPIMQRLLSRHLKARSADCDRNWNWVKKTSRSRLNRD